MEFKILQFAFTLKLIFTNLKNHTPKLVRYQILLKFGIFEQLFSRGFLVNIWSPVRLTEVMKLFENLKKNCNLAGSGNFSN